MHFSMTHRKPVILSFSGGKDSLLSLYKLRMGKEFEVISLLTTLDEDNKVLMHGFESSLLDEQAAALSLPLCKVVVPKVYGRQSEYATTMKKVLEEFKRQGVIRVAFGDIFLEEVKNFREEKLSWLGMESIFPLWGENPDQIAREFLESGFRAVITCVNTKLIPKEWIGQEYNKDFLNYLTARGGIDLCGENGEFHTFVYTGPCFQRELCYRFDFDRPIHHNEFYAYVALSEHKSAEASFI